MFENVIGDSSNDTLVGNSLANTLTGNNWNDLIVGNSGDDPPSGANGRDLLIGGVGIDPLLGGNDNDILIAGKTTSDGLRSRLNDIGTKWDSIDSHAVRLSKLRAELGSSRASLKSKINVLKRYRPATRFLVAAAQTGTSVPLTM